jgi:sugar phosphate permease
MAEQAVSPASAGALRRGLGGIDHRWFILSVGVAAQASFAAAFQGIPAVSGPLRDAYRLTTAQLGVTLMAIALGIALTEVLWGIVVDRVGERPVLVWGLAATGTCLGLLAVFLVPENGHIPMPALFGGLLAVGAIGGSVNGSSGRAVMGWFTTRNRGIAMAICQTAVPLGGAFGAALLPVLALHLGFRAVFAALAVLCIAAASAAYVWLWDPPVAAHATAPGSSRARVPNPLGVVAVWRLAVASGLLTIPSSR